MPNCEKLAKWFLDKMKATEVIYFKVDKTKKNKQDKESQSYTD